MGPPGGPPRRRRRTTRLVVPLAVAIALAACSDDDGGDTTTATLDLAPSTTATLAPEDEALAGLVLTEVPLPGFVLADDVLGGGPLTLADAASAEPDPSVEEALLEETGFERGVARAWLDPGQDVVYIAVYDFADAEGAASYGAASADRLVARGASTFDVPEVPGARGYTTVEEGAGEGEEPFTTHAVPFVAGDRWVLTLVASPSSTVTPDQARAVAAAQVAALG